MSFSAPFDHSSPTYSLHSLQNAHSFLHVDRLSCRRRPHGSDRLHRHRRAEMGPDLCQRKIDPIHSFPNATDFIDTDGTIKAGEKDLRRIAPALAENPLNLSNFGVPYSLNRKNRWNLTELSAGQLNTTKCQVNDSRVSIVWQKTNPMRKGAINGNTERFWHGPIGRFEEDKVAKLSTFDAQQEINCLSKSARGANSTAQLMQKGPKPKKRRSRRNGSDATGEQVVERWLDLFEPRDYSAAANPTPKCSTWSTAGDGCPPPVHTYYTFCTQSASRHQLNSGWQDKGIGKTITKEEQRMGGRWTTDWQGNAKWQPLTRRQIGLCLQNGDGQASAVVQKHRGIPCAKGGQRFAIEADCEDHFLDEDEHEEESAGWKDEEEMEVVYEQQEAEMAGRKALEIGDCLISNRGPKRSAKTKKRTKRSADADHDELLMDVLEEKEQSAGTTASSSSLSLSTFSFEKEKQKLCQLTRAEVDTIKETMGQLVPLDDSLNGLLPTGTSIFQLRSNAKTSGDMEHNNIQPGALLIIRKSITTDSSMDKYLINAATCVLPSDAADHRPPKSHQASKSVCNKNDSSFLSDLLGNDGKKKHLCLIESELLCDEAKADAKAVQLLFSELEQQKMEDTNDGQVQRAEEQLVPMPFCCPTSSLALSAVDRCASPTPRFCGVCFAECSDVDCFALRRCEPFRRTHTFCDDCWRQHIVQRLDSGHLPISCMAPNCPSVVRPSDALLVVGQPMAQRYCQLLAKRRRMWRDFVVCAQCDGTAHLRLDWQSLARRKSHQLTKCALCTEIICCRCAQRQHLPLSCDERELYELILHSHGHSLRSLIPSQNRRVAVGVRCTNCNNLVEKINGCDHIICHCGFEFCWKCGGAWKGHRNCAGSGHISVPLFDLVFTNGPNGKKMAKAPEKFFAECEEFQILRRSKGRLYKQMSKAFADERSKRRQWTEKYLQVSEFVELCLVKRMLSDKRTHIFGTLVDRLRFIFCSIPFIAKVNDAELKLSREMVERHYEEIMGISRQIMMYD